MSSVAVARLPGICVRRMGAVRGNLQHNPTVPLTVPGPTRANLSLSKTASPNPAIVGAGLSYRIVATNNGPSPATNATVTDALAAGPTFVSATPTQGT